MNEINCDQSKLFYIASTREIVRVKIHILACVADLPERCDVCSISRGNSSHTTRFGYISDKNLLQKSLKSCDFCFQRRINNVGRKMFNQDIDECTNYMDWNFETNNTLSHYDLPINYPVTSQTFPLQVAG